VREDLTYLVPLGVDESWDALDVVVAGFASGAQPLSAGLLVARTSRRRLALHVDQGGSVREIARLTQAAAQTGKGR
jgi:hypothetical protein